MAGFENPLWKQIQKIELAPDGTLHAPVSANAEDGVVIGEPPLGAAPRAEGRPGALARLLARLRRRREP